MLLVTLGPRLLENILGGNGAIATSHKKRINKGAIATTHGRGIIRAGEGATESKRKGRRIVRAGYRNKMNF